MSDFEDREEGELDDGYVIPPSFRGYRRRAQDRPLWFKVIDRFGFPTFIVIVLLVFGNKVYDDAMKRADRQEERQETRDKALNETMQKMAANVEEQTRTLHELRYLVDPKKKKNAAP
jgi:hypothetical protein